MIEVLVQIVSSCPYCKLAVGLSSGGGYFMQQSLLWNAMLLINSMHVVASLISQKTKLKFTCKQKDFN